MTVFDTPLTPSPNKSPLGNDTQIILRPLEPEIRFGHREIKSVFPLGGESITNRSLRSFRFNGLEGEPSQREPIPKHLLTRELS
jgi:hypothetical protein